MYKNKREYLYKYAWKFIIYFKTNFTMRSGQIIFEKCYANFKIRLLYYRMIMRLVEDEEELSTINHLSLSVKV